MDEDYDIISTHPDATVVDSDTIEQSEEDPMQQKISQLFVEEGNIMSRIITNLYVSNEEVAYNISFLDQMKIDAVLRLSSFTKDDTIIHKYRNEQISYRHIIVENSPEANLAKYLEQTYNFIDLFVSDNRNILVHCQHGISRSATIVIYYLMRKSFETGAYTEFSVRGIILDYLINHVRKKRSIIKPNPGFYRLLQQEETRFIDKYVK